MYKNDWDAAIARTARYGMATPKSQDKHKDEYLTQDVLSRFTKVLQKTLIGMDYQDLVLQCLAVHNKILPDMQNFLKCPVYFTIGWIKVDDGDNIYEFDEEFIENSLRYPKAESGGQTNLHAWLTLPSMEIFDICLATTFAVLQNLDKGHGAILAGKADKYVGFSYKPMLVGTQFLEQSGMLHRYTSQ